MECKIFADNTSLLLKVNRMNNSNTHRDSDLKVMSKRAFQLKILLYHRSTIVT